MLQIGLGGFLYVAAAPRPGAGEGVALGPIGIAVAGNEPVSARTTAIVRTVSPRRMVPPKKDPWSEGWSFCQPRRAGGGPSRLVPAASTPSGLSRVVVVRAARRR